MTITIYHTMKKPLILLSFAAAALPALAQTSAYTPAPGQLVVSPAYAYQNFEDFWMGRNDASLKPDDVTQHTGVIAFDFGITDRLAADVQVGYSRTESKAFGGSNSDDGMTDSLIGLRYKLIDETKVNCRWSPTFTLRVGAIIEGTYDAGLPFSAGDGGSGFETSLQFGKSIGSTGLALYGDIGYRNRNQTVPDDIFGSLGLSYTFAQAITLSGGYRHIQSLSGTDIGAPGFTFPSLREINQLAEVSLSYTDKGGRTYALFGAFSLDGRNSGDKTIFGATISIPIQLR